MTLTAGKELPMVEKFVGNQTFFAVRQKRNSVQPRDVHVLWGPKGLAIHFCDLKAAQILLIMI